MNPYKSSFLIIGKGVTYNNCKIFFDRNSISYKSCDTKDILEIHKDYMLITSSNLAKSGFEKIDLNSIDYVVVSPGISRENPHIKSLLEYKKKLITDIDIIQSILKSKFICVTGTNGKTSTVNLIANVLNMNDIKAIACGNNGVSVFNALDKKYDYVILEISSYQLEYINNLNSYISVILNISHDHLDRHHTFENYFNIKSRILNKAHYSITNIHYDIKNNNVFEIRSNKFLINKKNIPDLKLVNDEYIEYKKEKYSITGRHEALNLCACIPIFNILELNINDIIKAFAKREILPHRLEKINKIHNVTFINDSKSTNVSSTLNALNSFQKNIILIMGGDNKKISYKELQSIISEKVKLLILIGDNQEFLDKDLSVDVDKELFTNLEDATKLIFNIMKSGDIVLLSPGTSSFCMYKNYQERGNHFKKLVNNYAIKED